jgi:glycosyltransferase involved in cell wall biosynthesis
MLFSIVIPTYNREKILLRAIKSVLSQSFETFEIIVVDDGSTDDTEKVVHALKDKRIRYIKTENCGVAHARNTGIKNAVGDYISFLDSDDLYEKDHLSFAAKFIQEKNEPAIVHLNFLWGSEDRSIVHKNQLPKILPNDIFKSCSFHVNCIFIKKNIARQHYFNESRELMFAEDWDLFIKLAIRYPIQIKDHLSAYLIDHQDRNMRNFDEEKWCIKRDALVKSLLSDEIMSKRFPKKISLISAHMNSLIAVNLASRKRKRKSLRYFCLSLKESPGELVTWRTLAILKHLFLTW